MLLGTSRHVTQGLLDVKRMHWDEKESKLSGESELVGQDPYELRILMPKTTINGGWRLQQAAVSDQDAAAGFTVTMQQEGSLVRVTILSPTNRIVSWSVGFEKETRGSNSGRTFRTAAGRIERLRFTPVASPLAKKHTGDELRCVPLPLRAPFVRRTHQEMWVSISSFSLAPGRSTVPDPHSLDRVANAWPTYPAASAASNMAISSRAGRRPARCAPARTRILPQAINAGCEARLRGPLRPVCQRARFSGNRASPPEDEPWPNSCLSRAGSMPRALVWIGLRISTPISINDGSNGNRAPSECRKTFISVWA